ncbi:hypothetical protein VB780_04785 [Leptolyngbya sp. CCNP1308]|uniref:hypothetical protein n=1 Tax=Leptolyngbya sp. CCNP1308 TaxID=3110255 RepID=UPI002B1EED5C|nr:hypothetical protein [Leptolyngbya sp. CCNP1308]MEA5447874.1 hypothetical protein [Leptolyngbya sp. CCNP1308]
MKLLSRSALVASLLAAGLLATAGPGVASSGCALSNWGNSGISTLGDGPSGFWAASPDSNALGMALGGLGAIAALLTGGTLLVRQRWLTQAAAANGAVLEAEVDLSMTTETETVLVSEPAEIESEVALAYRR